MLPLAGWSAHIPRRRGCRPKPVSAENFTRYAKISCPKLAPDAQHDSDELLKHVLQTAHSVEDISSSCGLKYSFSTVCSGCGAASAAKEEQSLCVEIPISRTSVQGCVEDLFVDNPVTQYECEQCSLPSATDELGNELWSESDRNLQNATVKFEIKKAPDFLIGTLKRFDRSGRKITQGVRVEQQITFGERTYR